MPVYEYRCKECGKTHEVEHGFHDPRPTSCSSCGGHLVRVFHPVGVVFKGSGFHKTDYTSSGVRKEPSTESKTAAGESKSEGSKTADAGTATKSPSGSATTPAKSGDGKASKGTGAT
jgi:putative FmdB family regulatory protein